MCKRDCVRCRVSSLRSVSVESECSMLFRVDSRDRYACVEGELAAFVRRL